jgi:hypothetical protein
MSELFVSLLPFILGSALLPIQIIIVILILNSPHQGVLKASAYVGGMTIMRLPQGLVFGLILSNSELADDEQGKKPGGADPGHRPRYLAASDSL